MRRGEIFLVDLDPIRGAEANKRRPAVIISNNGANARAARLQHGVVTIIPLTTNTARVYPFQVLLPPTASGLARASKAQAEQVRAVAVERIGQRIGYLSGSTLKLLEDALRVHLGL